MKQYLVGYEDLARFVDSLIARKYPGQPTEPYASLRDKSIDELDDRIGNAVFGGLAPADLAALNELLDNGESDPAVFQQFFRSAGLDLNSVISSTLKSYEQEFLGGDYAE